MIEMIYLTCISAVIFAVLCYISVFLGAVAIIPLSACLLGLITEIVSAREERERFRRAKPLRWNGKFYD